MFIKVWKDPPIVLVSVNFYYTELGFISACITAYQKLYSPVNCNTKPQVIAMALHSYNTISLFFPILQRKTVICYEGPKLIRAMNHYLMRKQAEFLHFPSPRTRIF